MTFAEWWNKHLDPFASNRDMAQEAFEAGRADAWGQAASMLEAEADRLLKIPGPTLTNNEVRTLRRLAAIFRGKESK
ncbi:MAG TPA: hypothetical protein VGC81_03335 [Candidatus Methylomirabilis sp.]